MNENAPLPMPPTKSAAQFQTAEDSESLDSVVTGAKWKKLRWFTARAIAVLGSLILLAGTVTGFAGWYTSRPQFCRSCHIMEPYYVSWAESSHKNVSCVKCHFPPGAGEKIRGKLLGLAQLAKYVTGSGGPRPGAAEVPDASCLRSGCHETRLLSGRIQFKFKKDITVPFDHRPHLEQERRGKKLRCTSCHSQIVQGSHMTVTTSTCFLCHFKDEHFNEGLGACTRCHQIPDKKYDLGGGIEFSHDAAYARGLDCANCHGDLIRGNGDIPRERCKVCHNREADLKRFKEDVFIHQTHVTEHKVDCLSCHLEIKHALDPDRVAHSASDCAACHPNHHREQISMLQGAGAKLVTDKSSNRMDFARVTCRSCHRIKETSPTGTISWKGSLESCLDCHDAQASTRLQAYHVSLRGSLTEIAACVERLQKALTAAEDLPAERVKAITTELDNVKHDLTFLRVGNGAHNIHYASTLTRALLEQIIALSRELKVEEPTVQLPVWTKDGPAPAAEPGAAAKTPSDKAEEPAEESAEMSNQSEDSGTKPEVAPEKPDPSPTKPDASEPAPVKSDEAPAQPKEPMAKPGTPAAAPETPATKPEVKPAPPASPPPKAEEKPQAEPPVKPEDVKPAPPASPPPKAEEKPQAEPPVKPDDVKPDPKPSSDPPKDSAS